MAYTYTGVIIGSDEEPAYACAPTDAGSPVLEPIAAEHPANHYMSAETISVVKAVLGTNSEIKTLAPILNRS